MKRLLERFDLPYKNLELYEEAFRHTSFIHESHLNLKDYERLEFIGDSVLQLVTSEYIYRNYQNMDEGEMTELRSKAVREESLAKYARQFELSKYLKLGVGEEHNGGRDRDSVLANAFEAFLGAIYIDIGLEYVYNVISQTVFVALDNKDFATLINYKTVLQELVQADKKQTVTYEVIDSYGPKNDIVFEVSVTMEGMVLGTGIGKSKKKAEQAAAQNALEKLAGNKK